MTDEEWEALERMRSVFFQNAGVRPAEMTLDGREVLFDAIRCAATLINLYCANDRQPLSPYWLKSRFGAVPDGGVFTVKYGEDFHVHFSEHERGEWHVSVHSDNEYVCVSIPRKVRTVGEVERLLAVMIPEPKEGRRDDTGKAD